MSGRVLTSLLVLALAACTTAEGGDRPRPSVIAEPQSNADVWKGVATDADEQRIARAGLAWQEALQEARRAAPRDVEAEGALLRPRSALPRPAPTPGSYNCRLIKLGQATGKGPAFERFKPFFCYVEVEGASSRSSSRPAASARRPSLGGRSAGSPHLPRQPRPGRRTAAARLR